MSFLSAWRLLTVDQKSAFAASFFGWTLDAFDFFLLLFVVPDIMRQFHAAKKVVLLAVTYTLACRPVGALIFGLAADRFGRRLTLMVDVLVYSALELATGFSGTLTTFLVLRALFGIGMGGEWGVGAALALESAPAEARGALSGVLQEGYPTGYLLAAIVYNVAYPIVHWRGLFFIGACPALLSLLIVSRVKESPVWIAQRVRRTAAAHTVTAAEKTDWRRYAGLFVYLTLLMAAFNFLSHGTQDNYPNFLQDQHHFAHALVGNIAIFYNIGAIIGGVSMGALSQRWGRRRVIIGAALIALPIVPLWALSHSALLLALGAFLMQMMVQGAWGVIPAHLTELAPASVRGTFPGLAYQCGNLIASCNAPLQVIIAGRIGGAGSLGEAMALVVAVALLCTILITTLGPEKPGASLAES